MEKKRALVLASFAADSLSLGAHWIYDVEAISKRLGRVDRLMAPPEDSYHAGRKTGDFTHYGDQMLVLLESLAASGGFDLIDFSNRWRKLFEGYDGYIDKATKKTLSNYEKGEPPEAAGSHIPDFGGAARIAPIVCRYAHDVEEMADIAREQTAMTHDDGLTLDAADFFARVTHRVLEGTPPVSAIEEILMMEQFQASPVSLWARDGLKSKGEETAAAIARFGQACETKLVFPGVIHLIAKYEDDLKEALIQSVMAGGESAARGSMTGMVLAAHHGAEAIPREWTEFNRKNHILALLEQV